jgi:hypothetical protein
MEQDKIIEHFECCDTFFIGMKLFTPQSGEPYKFELKEPVTQFCQLLEVMRVKKDINNLRIIHLTKTEMTSELVNKF